VGNRWTTFDRCGCKSHGRELERVGTNNGPGGPTLNTGWVNACPDSREVDNNMCPVSWVMVDDVGGCGESFQPEVAASFGGSVPIVVLGGNSGAEDRMLLLELDTDERKKPVTPTEILARVRRVMEQLSGTNSRMAEPEDREVVSFGDVRVDMTSMEATRAGKPVTMTKQEFKIVQYFAKCPGRVVSREVLLNEVWGYNNYPSTRTVDNHILRLRQKLEPDPARPQYFLTMHGAGYKFVPEGLCLERCG